MEIVFSERDCCNEVRLALQDLCHDSLRRVLDAACQIDFTSVLETPTAERAFFYQIVCVLPNGAQISERELWERVSDFEDYHAIALDYARHVGAAATAPGGWHLWHSEWTPAGSYALAPLTFKRPQYVPELIDHARGCDLDHADIFTAWVHLLLRHHGWCRETRELLVHFCSDVCGPDGLANLGLAVHDLGFRDWLTRNNDLETFCSEVSQIIGDPDRFGIAKRVREQLFVGDDEGYQAALVAARAHRTDMLGRYPTKLRYAKYRYSNVPWDYVPEPGER